MGNRANYILKKDNDFDIYYTHWRAINVAQDLALGQKQFTKLVKEFDKADELLNEPWIEACVLLDFDSKKLTFWETEMLFETSVREEYLNQLGKIWTNWSISFAENEMYDVENELKVEYISNQEVDLEFGTTENLSDMPDGEKYFDCLTVIKENNQHSVKYVFGGQDDQLALIGESVIVRLKQMQNRELKKENSDDFFSCLIIDLDKKELWVNQSITGLKDELQSLWNNWKINVGNFGYIELLRKVGIDTSEIELKLDETKKIVSTEILNRKDDFNPNDLAKKLVNEMGKDVKFNENFFQNVKPKKTIWNKIRGIFK
jgi:hypothetical protein